MPKRDLSPAAVAEILHSKWMKSREATLTHRMRETLATSTIDRANEWTDRALTDGAAVCLVTHRVTGRVLATERPRRDDDPPYALHAVEGLTRRSGVHYTLWADTEWADLDAPIIEWDGRVREHERAPTGHDTSSGHFVVSREDVPALCAVVAARRAEREAAAKAEAAALTEATGGDVDRLTAALTALGIGHTVMIVGKTPTAHITLRGADQITTIANLLHH